MNKPISKHALRRAMEKVHAEGLIQYSEPIGTVVNRLWHEVEKASFNGARKRPVTRTTSRVGTVVDAPEAELP
jgi:hypothetical protein